MKTLDLGAKVPAIIVWAAVTGVFLVELIVIVGSMMGVRH